MVQVFNNILSESEIQILLDYHYINDSRTDSRETVRSKHPRWNIDPWPQHVIQKVFDKIIKFQIDVEEVIFNESKISFQVHVDSGYNNNNLFKNILIPLQCETGSTVLFNNYWHGDAAKFVRSADPYASNTYTKNRLSTKDQRITDYTNIDNFTNKPFDKSFYNRYLTHVPYENLFGLTVDKIVRWKVGDVIMFDRNQLHCASNEHHTKIGITIFTNLKI